MKAPTLFKIAGDVEQLLLLVLDAGGEITPEQQEQLDRLTEAGTDKILAIAGFCEQLDRQMGLIAEQKKYLDAQKKSMEGTRDRLKTYVHESMLKLKLDRIWGPGLVPTLVLGAPVLVIGDEDLCLRHCLEHAPHLVRFGTPEIDKKTMLADLKAHAPAHEDDHFLPPEIGVAMERRQRVEFKTK